MPLLPGRGRVQSRSPPDVGDGSFVFILCRDGFSVSILNVRDGSSLYTLT